MNLGYVTQKALEDEAVLRLKTWISDRYRGERMFQVELDYFGNGSFILQFPMDYQRWSYNSIRQAFNAINKRSDFDRLFIDYERLKRMHSLN